MRQFSIILIFLSCCNSLFSQQLPFVSKDSILFIEDIIVTGNKKTRTNIVLREFLLHKGDTINIIEFNEKLLLSKQLVFNTTLFVTVDVIVAQGLGNHVTIIVDVKERWYLFPLPHFKLVDRNFNEWWVNQNRSLERVNYGIKFFHNNLSGRNDKLSVNLITGYNREISFRYELPFFDKKLKQGLSVGYGNSSQKELNYNTTTLNKQSFFKLENDFVRKVSRGDILYTYRPDQYWRHAVRVSYFKETVADTVVKLNPNYLGDGRSELSFGNISYSVHYLKTNYNPYPTKGLYVQGILNKKGLDSQLDMWQVQLNGMVATPLSKKAYLRAEFGATAKFPTNNIFINQQLFGYGAFQMRGQDLYVVDGLAGAIAEITLGHELFTFNLKTAFKNKAYSKIPFKFYGKIFSDFGYSYNPNVNNNLLNNKLMRTWGFGLDILSIYDFVFRIEYSFNQLGNSGLFVNTGN